MQPETTKPKKRWRWPSWPASYYVVFLPICAPWAFHYYWFDWRRPGGAALSSDLELWAQFGDFIGGILNPVVASLALFWLIRSFDMQKKELDATRRVMGKQYATMRQQVFESAFFALLAQLRESVKGLATPPVAYGAHIGSQNQLLKVYTDEKRLGSIEQYQHRLLLHCPPLADVHSTLFSLLQFLHHHTSSMQETESHFYRRLILSQLNDTVLLCVTMLALPSQDYDYREDSKVEFKALIEEYALLEGVALEASAPRDRFRGIVMRHMDSSAFGSNAGYSGFIEQEMERAYAD